MTSAQNAIEEMRRSGWHDYADQAETNWTRGERYWPPIDLGRYIAMLITAANWEFADEHHTRRHRAA